MMPVAVSEIPPGEPGKRRDRERIRLQSQSVCLRSSRRRSQVR